MEYKIFLVIYFPYLAIYTLFQIINFVIFILSVDWIPFILLSFRNLLRNFKPASAIKFKYYEIDVGSMHFNE